MTRIPMALTIAGSDSGGGAGIQADLKTFQMRGVYGMSVITAITAQNTRGVFDIHTVPQSTVRAQIQAIAEDLPPTALKIGMLSTADIIECVAACLQTHRLGPLVLDPVMIAKGGAPLLQQNAIAALIACLLPQADIITPNLPEAEALTGIPITDDASAAEAAARLQALGAKSVVIKGGHSGNSQDTLCRDRVFLPDRTFVLECPRFDTPHTHGTGCTFSACITAELAKGHSMEAAIRSAKAFITAAISHPLNIGSGHGPVNHWVCQTNGPVLG